MADEFCSPLVASGSQSDVGIMEEICYGDLPTNPELQVFPRTSIGLGLSKESYTSETVRTDRMTVDMRHGTRTVSGDIAVELMPGAHSMAYEALLGGVWMRPTQIALSTTNLTTVVRPDGLIAATLAGSTWPSEGFQEGNSFRFISTGNADYDGRTFSIGRITQGDLSIALLIPPPAFTAAAGTTLNAGGAFMPGAEVRMDNVYRSFLIERAFSDIGSFITYRGNRFNSMSVDLPATGIATATFGLMGKDADAISGASVDGVAELVLDETTLGDLTFDAAQKRITASTGSFGTAGITAGDVVLISGDALNSMPQNRNPRTVIEVSGQRITVAEAIEDGTATGTFTVTRVGLPDYTAATGQDVLVAVSGVLMIDGEAVGTVTSASISLDNGMAGSNVVGSNVMPTMLWGNRAAITGSLTVLFDRGGIGEKIYNAFDGEQDMSLLMRMDTASNVDFLSFYMPRIKINSGSIGDAVAEGLPVQADFEALKPAASPRVPASALVIQDSMAEPKVFIPPFTVPVPIQAAVAGSGSASVTVTITGGPTAGGEAVTVVGLAGPAGAITAAAVPALAAGRTPTQMATALANAINGQTNGTETLSASAAAGVVTITENGGANVTLTSVGIS